MSKIDKVKLQGMLDLQTSFNIKIDPNWKTAGYAYTDAIWTEAAEAFDHTNWEWWKKTGAYTDFGQIKMELVYIWHFVMSEFMLHKEQEGLNYVDVIELIDTEVTTDLADAKTDIEAIRQVFRGIVIASLQPADPNRIVFILYAFIKAMYVLGMDWVELYKLYIGKNTLNGFRQNNGYKQTTKEYKDRWAKVQGKGWEDNQFLTLFLSSADVGAPLEAFQLSITNELTHLWKTATP